MSNRLYAACYAAQRISIALAQAENSVASDPELAGAIVRVREVEDTIERFARRAAAEPSTPT